MAAQLAALTPREREILQLASEGYENDQIAEHLGLSRSSLSSYFTRIYEKLGVRQARQQAILRYLQGYTE